MHSPFNLQICAPAWVARPNCRLTVIFDNGSGFVDLLMPVSQVSRDMIAAIAIAHRKQQF